MESSEKITKGGEQLMARSLDEILVEINRLMNELKGAPPHQKTTHIVSSDRLPVTKLKTKATTR